MPSLVSRQPRSVQFWYPTLRAVTNMSNCSVVTAETLIPADDSICRILSTRSAMPGAANSVATSVERGLESGRGVASMGAT
eukprot:2439115-Prymnesium_polylepis.1